MRRIVALGALVVSAWYLRKRWRSIWLQGGLQTRLQTMVSLLRAGIRGAPAMFAALAGAARLGALAGAARARAEYVRARAMATASTAAGMARGASGVGVRKAEEGTSAAAQGAADAAGGPEPPKPTAGEPDTGGPATPTTGME